MGPRPDGTSVQGARRTRPVLWTVSALLLVLVAGRLALTPLAERRTRQVLASIRGYRGDFSDVSVSLLRLSYTIEGIDLVQDPESAAESKARPHFHAKRIEISLDWREIVRRRVLVAAVKLEEPKLHVTIARSGKSRRGDVRIGEKMSRLSPLAIERIEIKRAELAFADEGHEDAPAAWLHDLDAAMENLATRPWLAEGEPALLALSGTLQRTGQVSVFVTADPFAKRVTFSGRASIKGLDVREVRSFFVREMDLAPKRGTIDLIAEFHVREGRLRGGVKPILKDVEVSAAKPGLAPKLKEWLVEAGQRPAQRNDARRSATGFVPIGGDIIAPDADLWPTVLRLLRNAFTSGLTAGLQDVPSPAAKERRVPEARQHSPRRRPR
jgi:hypothetical protein